jgi:uncharacterized membrane protein YbaN (DUF454 family)
MKQSKRLSRRFCITITAVSILAILCLAFQVAYEFTGKEPLWLQIFLPGVALILLWKVLSSEGGSEFWARVFAAPLWAILPIVALASFLYLELSGFARYTERISGYQYHTYQTYINKSEFLTVWGIACVAVSLGLWGFFKLCFKLFPNTSGRLSADSPIPP